MKTNVVKTEDKSSSKPKSTQSTKAQAQDKSTIATPENKEAKTSVNQPAKTESAATLLKNYAAQNKKLSPKFKDLGERKNGQTTECAVECSFADASAVGVGKTRSEARENACRLLAEKIGIIKKNPTPKKPSAKHGGKKPSGSKRPAQKKGTRAPGKKPVTATK